MGCPCLNENLKCCASCSCGTKKAACKNKTEAGQEMTNPSAFARHRRAVEESEVQIKVKLCLLRFLCNLRKHKGSIFLVSSTLFPSKFIRLAELQFFALNYRILSQSYPPTKKTNSLFGYWVKDVEALNLQQTCSREEVIYIRTLCLQKEQEITRELGVFVAFAEKCLMSKKTSAVGRGLV